FEGQPEADVMSLVGASAVRLFERELFLLAHVIERADRRIMVWSVKHHAADDLSACAQRNWVGRKPAGRMHGAENFFLAADESDIERVSRNTVKGTRYHGQGSETRLMFVMAPQGRQYDIGQHQVGDEHAHENDPPSSPTYNVRHSFVCSLHPRDPPNSLGLVINQVKQCSFRRKSDGLAPALLFREHRP